MRLKPVVVVLPLKNLRHPYQKIKKGKISVTYDTKRVGVFVKTITVFPEGLDPITLTIKGNVMPEPNQ